MENVENAESFDLRKVFQLISKRKGILFLIIIVSMALAVVMSLLTPKVYKTQGSMIVSEHKNPVSTKAKVDPQWYVNTQMELMKSQGVVRRVAKTWINRSKIEWIDLEGNKHNYSVRTKNLVEGNQIIAFLKNIKGALTGSHKKVTKKEQIHNLVEDIQEKMHVTNTFGSNYFFIGVQAGNPELSAALTNGLMNAYRQENLALKREEMKERIQETREAYEQSQDRYNKAKASLDEYSDKTATLRATNYASRLENTQDKLAKLEKVYEEKKRRLSADNPEVKKARSDIEKMKEKIVEIKEKIREVDRVKRELEKKTTFVRDYLQDFLDKKRDFQALKNAWSQVVSDAVIAEVAIPPKKHYKPKLSINLAIALVASTLFGIALAFFLEFISRKVKSESDLAKATGSRVFCTLPAETMQGYVGDVRNLPEQYRLLRTSLMATLGKEEKSLLLTGTQKENDNTPFVAANLALAFSLLEERDIILVDCDLRNPRIHEIFGMELTYGLVDYVIGALKDLNAKSTSQTNLKLITVGQIPPNPAELLESKKMSEVVEMLENSSDIVIFCSSSMAAYPDASVLASLADRTILSATVDETTHEDVTRVKRILNDINAKIAGAVLVDEYT